jgi:S-adenosylmethionine hydrolase
MAIVTLTTDFGLEDAYVGIVKGVVLTANPAVTIVDVTHNISPGDVDRAAYLLETAYGSFPHGSVHVAVVDPGVGSERRIIAVELNGHRFLAPDNGVLTGVLMEGGAGHAVSVENTRYFLSPVSRTFHGRDIFAPVAAHLSKGLGLEDLGPSIDFGSLVRLDRGGPVSEAPHGIVGSVVAVDRFGNLITNIRKQDLSGIFGAADGSRLEIKVHGQTIRGLSSAYASVAPGEPLAILGSSGRVEISINGGNAGEVFGAGIGKEIRVDAIRFSEKQPV